MQPATPRQRTKLFHVLESRDFDRTLLDELCNLTNASRNLAKSREGAVFLRRLLAHRKAMLYFTQPSTRTFLSFNTACQVLGITTSEIRDPSTSSELKGESFDDSIRTFSSYVDVIIMRTAEKGRAAQAARLMDSIPRPIPIINAGSGPDQHPTQALLDIYTIARSLEDRGGIANNRIGLMGDLLRGRTVRSLAQLLCNYPGVEITFISPPGLAMGDDIKRDLTESGITWTESDSLAGEIGKLDVLYLTRLQSEYDKSGEKLDVDYTKYAIHPGNVNDMKKEAVIMHPLPRGPELDPVVDNDPRSVYWRQERNGMWMRVAVLIKICGEENAVLSMM